MTREEAIKILNDDEWKSRLGKLYRDAIDIAFATLQAQAEAKKNPGEISDGYHTFNEVYHHRAVLFSVICNQNPERSWKSKKHHDGTMYDGIFIVGIDTPDGPATYHYDINPYWDIFTVPEVDRAPKWDGHTPGEAIRRIGTLAEDVGTATRAWQRAAVDCFWQWIGLLGFAYVPQLGIFCYMGKWLFALG